MEIILKLDVLRFQTQKSSANNRLEKHKRYSPEALNLGLRTGNEWPLHQIRPWTQTFSRDKASWTIKISNVEWQLRNEFL